MKRFVLLIICLLSLTTLNAQVDKKAKTEEVNTHLEKTKLQVAAIVGAIVSDADHQKLRKEMGGSSNYIPKKYLNIVAEGFDKPSYNGNWEQDLLLFKTAIAKWKQKSPEAFKSYLKKIGLE